MKMTADPRPGQKNSDLCQSCGLCCNGAIWDTTDVSLKHDEQFATIFVKEIESRGEGKLAKVTQPCVAFKGHCTQYEIRPHDCRSYQCKLLKQLSSGTIDFHKAQKTVNTAKRLLDSSAEQYNALYGDNLTRDEIAPVLRELSKKAHTNHHDKKFWQTFPHYVKFLAVCEQFFED